MNGRRFFTLAALALLVLGLLAPASTSASVGSPGSAPLAQIQPWEQFRIRLTMLFCQNEQDSGLLFSSDEPYVIVGMVRAATLADPPSLTMWHTDVYNGVDAGEGRVPNLDVLNGNVQGVVALVTQVVESDGDAPLAIGNAMVNANVDFADALAAGIVDPMALGGVVANSIYDAVQATDDDPIGSPNRLLLTLGRFDSLVPGQSTSAVAQVQGDGSKYTAVYTLTRTR